MAPKKKRPAPKHPAPGKKAGLTAQQARFVELLVVERKGPPWIPISRGCVRYSQEALEEWLRLRTITEIPQAS